MHRSLNGPPAFGVCEDTSQGPPPGRLDSRRGVKPRIRLPEIKGRSRIIKDYNSQSRISPFDRREIVVSVTPVKKYRERKRDRVIDVICAGARIYSRAPGWMFLSRRRCNREINARESSSRRRPAGRLVCVCRDKDLATRFSLSRVKCRPPAEGGA